MNDPLPHVAPPAPPVLWRAEAQLNREWEAVWETCLARGDARGCQEWLDGESVALEAVLDAARAYVLHVGPGRVRPLALVKAISELCGPIESADQCAMAWKLRAAVAAGRTTTRGGSGAHTTS